MARNIEIQRLLATLRLSKGLLSNLSGGIDFLSGKFYTDDWTLPVGKHRRVQARSFPFVEWLLDRLSRFYFIVKSLKKPGRALATFLFGIFFRSSIRVDVSFLPRLLEQRRVGKWREEGDDGSSLPFVLSSKLVKRIRTSAREASCGINTHCQRFIKPIVESF